MKDLHEVAGVSKQAFHKARICCSRKDVKAQEFLEQADKIRKEHPGAGCRKMAAGLICKGWGRDKIERLLLDNGYRVYYPRRFARTTDHRKAFYYSNCIEGLELNNINQVIQTDITYYRIKEKFFYIVFIIDVYSRRIVGHSISKSMQAEANIKALNQMLALRKNTELKGLIHHSDRGSQYVDKEYRKILLDHEIIPSMCKNAWENAYSERINRTIKEEYLDGWEINDYATLSRRLNQAVHHYNRKRGHESIDLLSPTDFEKNVENMQPDQRSKITIYKHLERCPQPGCE
jgi:transposase InsO family protein